MDTVIDLFVALVSFVLAIGAAYGLALWAHKAKTDRSAIVGLYLLFGIPGVLLTVAGAALTVNSRNEGPFVLAIGIALLLPLIPSFRKLLARFTPFDPKSPIDFTGLGVILVIIAFLGMSTLTSDAETDDTTDNEATPTVEATQTAQGTPVAFATPTTEADTIAATDSSESDDDGEEDDASTLSKVFTMTINMVTFVSLAYIAVGYRIWRNGWEATERLGLRWPTLKTFAIGLAFVVPVLMSNFVGGFLTQQFQPDTIDGLNDTLDSITEGFNNPFGALFIGLTAGLGEELFFRGALQARFGIPITALLFALMHQQYELTWVLLGMFGIGILLGIERRKFGTSAAIITHATLNIIAVIAQSLSS